MDQFRQIGEVVGSLKALMVLKHDIQINQRQCCLLFDLYVVAFDTIAQEIRQNLKLEEKNTKWKVLEQPMKELHRIFREGELYIRNCLDIRDWWGKAISLHQNKDCVEFHVHNLLCCFPVVIEAIETAAEISGLDHDDMQRRRLVLARKYDTEWNDPKLFQWMFGNLYLVPREICNRLDTAWREDRWFLLENIKERKSSALVKNEQKLGDLLLKKLNGSESLNEKLLPSSILVGAKDYYVKRRLGSGGGHYKEIQWMGENFALRTFFGEIEPLRAEISLVLSLSHPNVMQYHCGFYEEERKEGFLVMELMSKSLCTYIKENCGQRKRVPFSLPVAVDIMLQIARGMEYLHSRKIYHGDLNPSNVLIKARNSNPEGYFQAKLTGFGLTSIKSYTSRTSSNQNGINPVIWYAPEVLAEQERAGDKCSARYTEKADVYSFGMLCFELLTGKVPFEDDHLQGDKMVRNIRAGERPLFPHPSPKYLANFTRKCWQSKPIHRPSFSSICRILRYIKKILVINPDHGQPEMPPPLVDYCDIEAGYSKKFSGEESAELLPVSQIPFQMFTYRLVEKEKISGSSKWDVANEAALLGGPASICGDENAAVMDDLFLAASDRRSVCSEILQRKNSFLTFADHRSVFSEVPHRKFLSADQRSVCSESPMQKYLSVTEVNQSPLYAETPERKFSSTPAANQSHFATTPERKFFPTTPKQSVAEIPEKRMLSIPERKLPQTTAADEQRSQEKKLVPIEAEKTPACAEISETKSPKPGDPKTPCPETPERKTLPALATNQRSVCTVIPEKAAVPTTATSKQTVRAKTSEKKKVSSTKKLKDAKAIKGSG
ncbi:hypothetical protein RJ640_019012 [Escallonia rubra]|uniref:Protein kinase domain-containing protein n=1 Tax=Escallonia rubra TaxID=112253 RepID=A0AA88QBX9_9ASTE|nr:hypothetical protein RJ640_019012 [Escallonia rubra]